MGTDTTEYTYDALGNLTRVELPNGTVIGYLLDAMNRRIGKTVSDTLVKAWLYQGQLTPVAELDGAGTVVSRFVYATGVNVPDYLVRGDSTYRLIRDHLGSVRLVVNVASGTIAQRVSYDEFGIETENTNPGWQPFGYAGGLTESQTGLVRFGARDYDPVAGRWTAKDPIGFAGGAASLYAYTNGDPINYVDIGGASALSALYSFGKGVFVGAVSSIVVVGATAAIAAASPAVAAGVTIGLAVGGVVGLGLGIADLIQNGGEICIDQLAGLAGSLVGGALGGGLAARGIAALRNGALTAAERGEIQTIANKFDTTIDVVGSRAAGRGRNVSSSLPVGKGPHTRSDIDFRIDGNHPQVGDLINELRSVGSGAGSAGAKFSTADRPTYPPFIRFEPNQ